MHAKMWSITNMYNNLCFIGNAENYHTSSLNVVNGFPGQQSSFTLSSASSEYLMSIPSSCKTCKSLDLEKFILPSISTNTDYYIYQENLMPRYILNSWIGVEYGGTSIELSFLQPVIMHNIIHKSTLKLISSYLTELQST